MQSLAFELGLAETAYVVPRPDGDYDLRWFTPTVEIPLCGHATLAMPHTRCSRPGARSDAVTVPHPVRARSPAPGAGGRRSRWTSRRSRRHRSSPPPGCSTRSGSRRGRGARQQAVVHRRGRDRPPRSRRSRRTSAGSETIVDGGVRDRALRTAPASTSCRASSDPGVGVDEDPVTGSVHCALTPYWAAKLGHDRARRLPGLGARRHPALPARRRPRVPRRARRHRAPRRARSSESVT